MTRSAINTIRAPGAVRRWQLLVFLLVLIVFAPTIRNDFVNWDDTAYIHNNPLNRTGSGLIDTWTTSKAPQYYPLTFTLFWLEYQFWGTRATGYHVVSVALHAVNAAIVVALLAELGISVACAGVVALLFAIAPFQVMSVAWVAEQKNLLSTLFALLSLIACGRFFRSGSAIAYAAALPLFAAALLSKAVWAVFPLVAGAAGAWIFHAPRRRSILAMLPFLSLSVAVVAIAARVERQFLDATIPPLLLRVCLAPRALLWYAAHTIVPISSAPIYPRWTASTSHLTTWWPMLVVVLLAAALLQFGGRIRSTTRWGLLTFTAMLLPVLGLFPYGNLAVATVSDHYLHAACIGLYAAVVPPLAVAMQRFGRGRAIGVALTIVIGAATAVESWRQIPVWRDDLSLWQRVVERDRNSLVGLCGRGKAWIVRGETEKAIEDYRRVLDMKPDFAEARADLGQFLIAAGRNDEAAKELTRALVGHPQPAMVLSHLGVAQERRGDIDGAADAHRRAIALAPDDPLPYARLGELLARRGRYREAVEELRAGLSRAPSDRTWRLKDTLSRILATSDDAGVRDPSEAVRLAEANCQAPNDESPESLDTLAIAYASAGRYAEAARAADDSIRRFEEQSQPIRADAIRARLKQYRQRVEGRSDGVSSTGRGSPP